jgi:hypothetical protein
VPFPGLEVLVCVARSPSQCSWAPPCVWRPFPAPRRKRPTDAWWTGAPAAAQSESAGPSTDEPASLEEEEPSSDPRRSCATLIKQIAHYEGVKGLAEHRGDELWEHGTNLQLERLRDRQRVQCPEDVPPNAGQRMAVFAAQAALLAYQLFMMGLL